MSYLQQVQKLLNDSGVTLKLKSVLFCQEKTDYLVYAIHQGKSESVNTIISPIKEVQNLTNQTEFRSFLELCNVFRRFVLNFTRVAVQLNKKRLKNKPTKFQALTASEKNAVKQLKLLL